MIMMGLEFTGQPPFTTVYLHGLVGRAGRGRQLALQPGARHMGSAASALGAAQHKNNLRLKALKTAAGAGREGAQDEQEPGQRGGPRGDDWAVRRGCGACSRGVWGAGVCSPCTCCPLHGTAGGPGSRRRSHNAAWKHCVRPSLPHPPPLPPPPPADALRYTLATGTSPGQDLNLSLDRVNASRNFTNKLWNAGKFVLFNLEKVG